TTRSSSETLALRRSRLLLGSYLRPQLLRNLNPLIKVLLKIGIQLQRALEIRGGFGIFVEQQAHHAAVGINCRETAVERYGAFKVGKRRLYFGAAKMRGATSLKGPGVAVIQLYGAIEISQRAREILLIKPGKTTLTVGLGISG